jgi:hypothetical protein
VHAAAAVAHLGRRLAGNAAGVALHVHDVEVVEDGDHDRGRQEGEDWAEDPEQERHAGVEEPVADEVEREAALQDLADVVPGVRQAEVAASVVGMGGKEGAGGVDEEAGLVEEADGEGVAEEGEEEEQQQRHVLERHHVLAVRAEHGVAQRLLDGVGAAQHRGDARAEEDRRRAHQRGPHDHVPKRLNHRHSVLPVVLRRQVTSRQSCGYWSIDPSPGRWDDDHQKRTYLHHADGPEAARGGVDAERRAQRAEADGAPQQGVVRDREEQAQRDQHQVQEAVPPLHDRPAPH